MHRVPGLLHGEDYIAGLRATLQLSRGGDGVNDSDRGRWGTRGGEKRVFPKKLI